MNNKGAISYNINGNEVVGFTSQKSLKALMPGYADLTTLQSAYNVDPIKIHLGMQRSWKTQYRQSFPIYQELLERKSIIEVDGFNGEFFYDTPVYQTQYVQTEGDTSDQEYAGIDGSVFKIILNEQFTKGDVLTTDPWYGTNQIVVDSDEDVQQVGSGYLHYVKLTSLDNKAYYPAHLLKPQIRYTKINHVGSEYVLKFSTFQLPGKSTAIETARFKLGGIRGTEGYVTAFADAKRKGYAALKASMLDLDREESFNGGDMVMMSKYTGQQENPFDRSSMTIGTLVEWLVHKELDKLTAKSLLWQTAGVIRDTNGETLINEGLWHQLRRGKIISYGRAGGITKQHIKEAMDYVFQANPMPVNERVATFKCGRGAYDNVMSIFQDEALAQIGRLGNYGLYGSSKLLRDDDNPIRRIDRKDNILSLGVDLVEFKELVIPGIGKINIEHDPSLDYVPGVDENLQGMHHNGYSHSTYSMIIWDVTDQRYTNNEKDLPISKGGQLMEGGNSNSNIFLVKPEGELTYTGTNNGRWDGGKSVIQQGGLKHLAQEFFAYNSSAIFVRDVTKMVMIELTPNARLGYNGGF